jgi:hypothetical protein
MRKILTSAFAATAIAVLLPGLAAAQGPQSALVSIQPAASLDVVLFDAANAGKVVARTDARGKGTIQVAALLNIGKLAVVDETCTDGTRVLLVSEGTQVPSEEGCHHRRIGAFWPGRDNVLQVKLGGGVGVGTKAAIAGAAGAGAFVFLRDREPQEPTIVFDRDLPDIVHPEESEKSDPITSHDATVFNGTYTGSMTASTNTCSFAPTTPIRGVLMVDSDGRGTWQKTHLNAGVTFNFNIVLTVNGQSSASFTASTTQQVGSRTYAVTDSVTISGNTITITQTFEATTNACTVRYTGQLTKN